MSFVTQISSIWFPFNIYEPLNPYLHIKPYKIHIYEFSTEILYGSSY